jgi:GDP-4-dehydro-6-deoxy-D-mannose reductase
MSGRVLATGAGGFVGGHLLDALGGDAVACAADVADGEALRQALADVRPDAVIHLAALSSVAQSWRDAAATWLVNAIGTVNLLDAVAREARAARVLVVSSSEVYGRVGDLPVTEDAPVAPISPYGASKAAAEVAAARAARADGLDVVVVRPFAHIGPGQSPTFAVGSWVEQVAALERAGGGTLLVGDLRVRRDLTDVRDVVRAYLALLDRAVAPGTYNVASGRAVALGDVLDALRAAARCPIEVRVDEARLRANDLPYLCGDASRLAAATGWRPEIDLAATLQDALAAARARATDEVESR